MKKRLVPNPKGCYYVQIEFSATERHEGAEELSC